MTPITEKELRLYESYRNSLSVDPRRQLERLCAEVRRLRVEVGQLEAKLNAKAIDEALS